AALFDRPAALASYLTAYLFWLGIALGSLAWVLLHYLVGGFWGFLIRRPLEAAMRTLPLMALLFLPLLVDLGSLYRWARPLVAGLDPALGEKRLYLNTPAFVIRAAIYFALWIGMAWWIGACSRRQDEVEDDAPTRRAQALAGPGLVLYFLSMTFAAV